MRMSAKKVGFLTMLAAAISLGAWHPGNAQTNIASNLETGQNQEVVVKVKKNIDSHTLSKVMMGIYQMNKQAIDSSGIDKNVVLAGLGNQILERIGGGNDVISFISGDGTHYLVNVKGKGDFFVKHEGTGKLLVIKLTDVLSQMSNYNLLVRS
jgi:hypothetical protein